MPLSPAVSDSMCWLTVLDLMRGQTLQIVILDALILAHATRSLNWVIIPHTSRSSPSVSQSFPPPTRMMRERGLSVGRSSRTSCRSLMTPPRLQMHWVATIFSSAMSLIMLEPISAVPLGFLRWRQWSPLAYRLRSLTRWRNSPFLQDNPSGLRLWHPSNDVFQHRLFHWK